MTPRDALNEAAATIAETGPSTVLPLLAEIWVARFGRAKALRLAEALKDDIERRTK